MAAVPGSGRGFAFAALAVVAASAPQLAHAGNTEHVRTPVLWPEAECIQVADRSQSLEFSFAYTIPHEDTLLSADELEDSRRHQFLALCRQYPFGHPPPPYVSVADLEQAITVGEDPALLDDPEATLETSVEWAGCWARITPDDARRPITFEAAEAPVVWDLDGLSPGTWMVAGYTWEPPINLWSRAPWVVRVVDQPVAEADPASLQVAATFDPIPEVLNLGDAAPLSGCLDAPPGTAAEFQARRSKFEDSPGWTSWASAEVDQEGALAWPSFSAPAELEGYPLVLRVVFEGPGEGGATDYVADAPNGMIAFGQGAGDDGDEASGDEGSSDEGHETPTDADTGTSEGPGSDDAAASCACHSDRHHPLPATLLPLAALALLPRRHAHDPR